MTHHGQHPTIMYKLSHVFLAYNINTDQNELVYMWYSSTVKGQSKMLALTLAMGLPQ